MEINFISKVNNLTADNGEFYFREDEELTYDVNIKPAGAHYELRTQHDTQATDRTFLSDVYELREVPAPENKILFEVYHHGVKYGTFYFFMPMALSYPVSIVVMIFDKVQQAPCALTLVFRRISSFIIKLDTVDVELSNNSQARVIADS